MKKFNKILSALLAVIMLLGSFTVATSAAIKEYDEEGKAISGDTEVDYNVTVNKYLGFDENGKSVLGFDVVYKTPEEKLASMEMMWEKHGYQLWVDTITGEVATVKMSTGEILFSNPWNVGNTGTNSLDVKKKLLSQIVVNYVDNDTKTSMSSCADAASRGQINIEYIKNGIRVEYSIGREQTRMLVPKLINKERFETKILKVMREAINEEVYVVVSDGTVKDPYTGKEVANNTFLYPNVPVGVYQAYELIQLQNPGFNMSGGPRYGIDNFSVTKVTSFYTLKDPEDENLTDRSRQEMEIAFPITKKMAVYTIDPNATTRELTTIENLIKTYAITYTYEELDYDHELTEYVGTDKAPPLFKMALEYSIDENGMSVRLPANGIRFDESLYQLESIEMLPYMGAGMNDSNFKDGGDGYTFFPDGSGSLFDFEQLNTGMDKTISGKVYGQDYAYHTITGTHQEAIRYPAFGVVSNYDGGKTVMTLKTPAVYNEDGSIKTEAVYEPTIVQVSEKRGFLAIIEEGDALAELATTHMSATSCYNTVKMIYYPRPKDSYNMADAISVGTNTVMTVVSERKYVGSYSVRYIMLTDDKLAEENNLASYYECSWMGMAVAYRNYLEAANILERLDENDVDDDIPLYIETFGTLMTTEKIMSIPVDVMTPLTTFEDIMTMYTELSDAIEASMKETVDKGENVGTTAESVENFSNINFKLTGYANGGMYATVPYHLNWESAVGGASGFETLVQQSKDNGFGIFPDFDFVYINATDVFDGVSLKNHAVKTIDNRYTSRREYSATYQTFIGYFELAIAPSCFERFVTKLATNYMKYNPTGISVSTLGTDLNSDFDEDDPLNREDSKEFTINALKQLSYLTNEDGNKLEIMTDGGNAYTWRYIDHIVNMPLNSSRYNDAGNSVPFIGVVLHGYVQFAGSPINEEGDIESAMLKAIENGASIYFTLAYQNAQEFKEDFRLNKYFSVRYDIWKEDIVEMYVELNNLLSDLQTKLIIDHDFLVGERVPDEDEIIADEEAKAEAERLEQLAAEAEAAKKALKEALETRHTPGESIEAIEAIIETVNDQAITIAKYAAKFDSSYISQCAEVIKTVNSITEEINKSKDNTYSKVSYEAAIKSAASFLENILNSTIGKAVDPIITAATEGKEAAEAAKKAITDAATGAGAAKIFDLIQTPSAEAANEIVSAVIKGATDKSAEYANDSVAAVKEVAAKALEAVKTSFNASLATGALDVATIDYNASLKNLESSISSYEKAVLNFAKAEKAALAAGIESDVIKSIVDALEKLNDGKATYTSEDKYTVASNNADKAYEDAKAAYNALTKEETSALAVEMLMKKVVTAENKLATAKAAFEIAEALYNDKLGHTAAEEKSYNTRKAAYDSAKVGVESAKSAIEKAKIASDHKDAFQAIVDTYNAKIAANANKTLIDEIIKTKQTEIKDKAAIDPNAIDLATLTVDCALKRYEYDTNTADYSSNLATIKKAYDQIVDYYAEVVEAVEAAELAKGKIEATWNDYKVKSAEAEEAYKIYAIAVLAAKFNTKELNELLESLNAELEELESGDAAEAEIKAEIANCEKAIAIAAKTVDELKAAYEAAAEADKAEAKLLLDAKTVATANEAEIVEAEYDKIVANKENYAKKIVSYEQFYNTAIKETEEAKAKQVEFEKIYAKATEDYNAKLVLEAKVKLFGKNNFDSSEVTAIEKLAAAKETLAEAQSILKKFQNEWAKLEAAAKKYKESVAAYDELLKKDISAMTEAELKAYKIECVKASEAVTSSKNSIELISTNIDDVNSSYKEFYARTTSHLTALEAAISTINDELSAAKGLYEELVKTNADATLVAEIKAIYENYAARAAVVNADYEAFELGFRGDADKNIVGLCGNAVELGFMTYADGKYALVSQYTTHKDYVKEIFAQELVANDTYEKTKYTCDDGSVVAVTYGGKNGNDGDAYRTFLLNYNSFAVTVTYGDKEYVLDAYGYIVINH